MFVLSALFAGATLASADDTAWSSGTPVCGCPAQNTDDIATFEKCLEAAREAPVPCDEDVDALARVSSTLPAKDSIIVVALPATEYAVLTTFKFTDTDSAPTCTKAHLTTAEGHVSISGSALSIDEKKKAMTLTLKAEEYSMLIGDSITVTCDEKSGAIFASDGGLIEADFAYQREAPKKSPVSADPTTAPGSTTSATGSTTSATGSTTSTTGSTTSTTGSTTSTTENTASGPIESTDVPDGASINLGMMSLFGAAAIYRAI